MAEWSCHLNSESRILLVMLPQRREECLTTPEHVKASLICRQQARVTGILWVHVWPVSESTRENGLPTVYAVQLISGCQSLLRLSDLLDKIAGGRKYQKAWVIKTLSCNIIKSILKSMTSIWKDILHTLSSTVGNVAEQKQPSKDYC